MSENRIYLRPIAIEDTDDIVRWRNNESVKRYFIYQDNFTKEEHINWFKTKVSTGKVIQFMIIKKESEKAIGSVYLRDVNYEHKKAEYGIFIGEIDNRGKGYGTQAATLVLDYAFNNIKLHRVYLRVFADNQRAIASYKKVGFSIEGILKDDVFVKGTYRDVVWMAAINPKDD